MPTTPPARVEEVHQRLLDLVYPTSLAVGADRLAFIAPSGTGGSAAVHVVPLTTDETPAAAETMLRLGLEPTLVRWGADGTGLWCVGVDGQGGNTLSLRHTGSGSVIADARVGGDVEDLWVLDHRTVLLRVADPGSDRDGMHLGRRVADEADPRVDGAGQRLRRLVHARVEKGTLVAAPLHLDGWTVWDADVHDGLVAVVASRDPLPAGYYAPSLLVAELGDGALRDVREVYRAEHSQLARPRISADHSCVLVLDGLSIVSGRVLCVHLEGPGRDDPAHRPDHVAGLDDVTDLGRLPDGCWWFAGWEGTGVQVGTFASPVAPCRDHDTLTRWSAHGTAYGDAGQPGLVVDGEGVGYTVWEAPDLPPEVVRLRLDSPGMEPVTSFNSGLSDLAGVVTTTEISWRSQDGTRVHGLLMRPADPGPEPLPLVLMLHGGPTWLWSAAFAPAESNYMALPLAAAGAAVLLPNPRGSSGRGQGHARAIIEHMGSLDLDDVLAGVDHLVDGGVVDPSRAAVMGLSYGGYLTAVAASRSDRFRAAAVLSGVSDWLGFVGTSAIGSGGGDGGYDRTYHPDGDLLTAQGRTVLVGRSPLYDAEPNRTPTLLLHGADDRITPLAQAELLYRVRAASGVPVELATYAGEGHELVDPEHQSDACRRIVAWLNTHGVLR